MPRRYKKTKIKRGGSTNDNKNIMCRFFLEGHSDDLSELCLGDGSHIQDGENFKNDLNNNKDITVALNNYVNKYEEYFQNKSRTNDRKLLQLINIRECGLERFLVFVDNKRIGIYLNPVFFDTQDKAKQNVNFPKYLGNDSELFYNSLVNNSGKIVGISSHEGERSDGIMFGQIISELDGNSLKLHIIGKITDNMLEEVTEPECGMCKGEDLLNPFFNDTLDKNDNTLTLSKEGKNLKIYLNEKYDTDYGSKTFDVKLEEPQLIKLKNWCNADGTLNRLSNAQKIMKRNNRNGMKRISSESKKTDEQLKVDIKNKIDEIDLKLVTINKDLENMTGSNSLENSDKLRGEITILENRKKHLQTSLSELEKETSELDKLFSKRGPADMEQFKGFDSNNSNGGYRKMRRTRGRRTKRCGSRDKSKRVGCTYSRSRLRSRKNKKLSRRR